MRCYGNECGEVCCMRVQWVKVHGYWVLWEFIFIDRFIRCPLVTALSRVVYHNVGFQSEKVL